MYVIRLRRALGPLAACWLLLQAATLIVGSTAIAIHAAELECTCEGDHGLCPMHHRSRAGVTRCLLQDAGDNDAGVLTPLLGHTGLVPTPARPLALVSSRTSSRVDRTDPILRPTSPDPPPPRA